MIDFIRQQVARDGFAVVPGAVDRSFLDPVLAAVADVLRGPSHSDLLRDGAGGVRKIAFPLALDPRFLVALADPGLLHLASGLSPCARELVLTWEDVLYKPALVGDAVPVHQDLALQSLPGPVYSLGVHLEDAADNPVWYLQGSHRLGPQTTAQVRALRDIGGFVPLAPRPGDIVVHDVLTVHYSEANTSSRPRTTWYLEFRTLSQLRADGRWPESWAHRRRALLFHACAARKAAGLAYVWPDLGPGETREGWLERPADLRIPHIGHGVEYDVTSPWYHFA